MKIEFYLETTLMKFLKSNTIDSIHVIDIIKEVGVCKGTFYKYYQDKYQLLIKCFQDFFYNEITENSSNWESFVTEGMKVFGNNQIVALNAFSSQDLNSVRHYNEKLLTEIILREVSAGDKYTEFSAKVFARCITDELVQWLKDRCAETSEELIERMRAVMPITLYKNLIK